MYRCREIRSTQFISSCVSQTIRGHILYYIYSLINVGSLVLFRSLLQLNFSLFTSHRLFDGVGVKFPSTVMLFLVVNKIYLIPIPFERVPLI